MLDITTNMTIRPRKCSIIDNEIPMTSVYPIMSMYDGLGIHYTDNFTLLVEDIGFMKIIIPHN